MDGKDFDECRLVMDKTLAALKEQLPEHVFMLGSVRFGTDGTQSWLMFTNEELAVEILPMFNTLMKEVYASRVARPVPGTQAH
jgi:hypothetical protein